MVSIMVDPFSYEQEESLKQKKKAIILCLEYLKSEVEGIGCVLTGEALQDTLSCFTSDIETLERNNSKIN